MRFRRPRRTILDTSRCAKKWGKINTRTKLPTLQFINLGEDGWKIAEYIASHSNLSAVDIIHLVTAYTFGCHILTTRDEQFMREGNKILETSKRKGDIKLCLPAKTLESIDK